MKDFYCETFIPKDPLLGLDSIQGYLEMAHWYHKGYVTLVDYVKNTSEHGSMIFILNQLKKDDLINLELTKYKNDDGEDLLELKQISLTIAGHKLLEELRKKSKRGQIKQRIKNLFWTVITTIITTLLVLKMKGI